jgi:hypothetical protein
MTEIAGILRISNYFIASLKMIYLNETQKEFSV